MDRLGVQKEIPYKQEMKKHGKCEMTIPRAPLWLFTPYPSWTWQCRGVQLAAVCPGGMVSAPGLRQPECWERNKTASC